MKDLFTPPTPPNQLSGTGTAREQSSQPNEASRVDIVDIKQYFHIIVKRIWLVALCFVVALAVSVVMMVRQVPVYSCKCVLLLSGGLPIPQRLQLQEVKTYGDYIETQERIIQSPRLRRRAIDRMDWKASDVNANLKGVYVGQEAKTSFLAIRVNSLDAVLGAEFANALAEEYINFKNEDRMDTQQSTVISLTRQANRLREELKKAEMQVANFVKENKVVAIQERGNIAAKYLADLSSQAAGYRTDRMLLEAQQPLINQASDEIILATLATPSTSLIMGYGGAPSIYNMQSSSQTNSGRGYGSGPESMIERGLMPAAAGWEGMRRRKAELEAMQTDLLTKFRSAHPKVVAVRNELAQVERQLKVEMQFALQKYYSQLEALEIKERAAQQVEKEWEGQALEVSRKALQYQNLQRQVGRLQGMYDLIFNRLKEIDISINIEPESIKIMEPAKPAGSQMRPKKLQSIFVAALMGIGIGIVLVFGLEYIDDSIRYPDDVARGLGLTFYGLIPTAHWDSDDLASHLLVNIDQKSGLAEAYRKLRSSLLFSGRAQTSLKHIALTSSVPKEGKTTTSLNISISLAQAGNRVLLVDADMRRGELHKYFGLEAGRGFSDMLTGQIKPESIVQRTNVPMLDLVATGPFPTNPSELVLRPEFKSFMKYAERTYDRIIYDCPPLMAVSESNIICAMVDGVIFVVWAGQTSRKLAKMSVQTLRESGANVLGCVLNNLEYGRVGYYYYSTYYGYYDYDYHYEKRESDQRPSRT